MAKIPRIEQGGRPSAVVGPVDINLSLAETAASLSTLAKVGETITADTEKTEAKRLRKIEAAKQAILDEVDAGVRASAFEQDLRDLSKNIRDNNFDDPDRAVTEFTRLAQERAEKEISETPNAVVALKVTKSSNSRVLVDTRQMASWSSDRKTQKAKGDVSEMVNRATRGAEDETSSRGLVVYLEEQEAKLLPLLRGVLGNEAQDRMDRMKSEAVEAWASSFGELHPFEVLKVLDQKSGPLVDHLTGDQRKQIRTETRQSVEKLPKISAINSIKEGMEQNPDLFNLYEDGALKAAIVGAHKRSIENQLKVIEIDDRGFNDAQKKEMKAPLESRLKFLKALDKLNRLGMKYDAVDNSKRIGALFRESNDLFKKNEGQKGKDLILWLKHLTNLTEAAADKEISESTYSALFKKVSLALPKAAQKARENTGWDFGFRVWRDGQQAGNDELNDRFRSGTFSILSEEQKQQVQISFQHRFNEANEQGGGREVSRAEARIMALQALSLETGQKIPGVEQ